MLLVDDGQGEVGYGGGLLQQRVCANEDIDATVAGLSPKGSLLSLRMAAKEQSYDHRPWERVDVERETVWRAYRPLEPLEQR